MQPRSAFHQKSFLLTRAIQIARAEGARGLLRRFADRCSGAFRWEPSYLMYYPVDPHLPLPPAANRLSIARLDPADTASLEELVRIYGVPADLQGVRERINQPNELCYIGCINGRMVAYIWVQAAGNVQEYGKTLLTLRPGDVYLHDVHVVPELRGQGLYPAMKTMLGRHMAREFGTRRMVGYIVLGNHASMNASRKLGERRYGFLICYKLFGRRFVLRLHHPPIPL